MTTVRATVVESEHPDVGVGSQVELTLMYNTNPYPEGFKSGFLDELSRGTDVVVSGGQVDDGVILVKLGDDPGWREKVRLRSE